MELEKSKKLLLVEDEVLIAMVKQKELEKYGYTVLHVNTGEKALIISKEDKGIDLILMDIDLGSGIDGTEAAVNILKNRDIPILFMSSHTESEIVEKTEKITSYGYVVKSSSITVLDASIKMAFKLFDAHIEIDKSKNILSSLFNSIEDNIFIIDLDKNFTAYHNTPNSKMIKHYEQYDGKSIFDILPGNVARETNNSIESVLRTEKNQKFDFSLQIDKGVKYYESNINPMFDNNKNIIAFVSIYRDITDRITNELALQKRESLVEAFIDTISDLTIIFNEDGDYLEILSSDESLLSRQREDLLGNNIQNFFPKEKAEKFKQVIRETIKTDKPQVFEYSVPMDLGDACFQARTSVMKTEIDGKKTVAWNAHKITKSKEEIICE